MNIHLTIKFKGQVQSRDHAGTSRVQVNNDKHGFMVRILPI